MLTDAQGSPRTIMEVRESPTNPKLISTSSPKKSARSFKSWRKPHERSFHPVHRLYRLFMPASAVSETKYKPLQHQRAFQYLLWGLILQCAFHASQNRNESRRGEVPAAKKRKRTSKRCNCPFATKYPPRATNIPGAPKGAVKITNGSCHSHGGGCMPGQARIICARRKVYPTTKSWRFVQILRTQ